MFKLRHGKSAAGKGRKKSKLHWAAITGDHHKLSQLLLGRRKSILAISKAGYASDINTEDVLGRTPLHWAATRGEEECCKRLIENPKTECFHMDKDKKTPLHDAAISGHDNIIDLYIAMTDIEQHVDDADNLERTPLHWAAENGKEKAVLSLLNAKACVSKEDKCKETALYKAAKNGHEFIASKLTDAGASEVDKSGALGVAIERGHRDIAMRLFEKRDFDDKDIDFVERLVENFDSLKEKLLLWAATNGHPAVVERLFTLGAEVDTKYEHRTALSVAAEKGHEAVVERLLAKGAKVDTIDRHGCTALILAAENGYEAVVERLLIKGAAVDVMDKYGRTALFAAAENGHEAVVERLLIKGAAVDVSAENGWTALILAAVNGHKGVVERLLTKGAVVDVKDNDGKTALMWATEGEHESVIQLLKRHQGNSVPAVSTISSA